MASLAAFIPGFLKRRKRTAEEDEAHELRSSLYSASRAVLVEACVELHAANKALTQRNAELQRMLAACEQPAAGVAGVAQAPVSSTPAGGDASEPEEHGRAAAEQKEKEELAAMVVQQKNEAKEAEEAASVAAYRCLAAGVEQQLERDLLLGLEPTEFNKLALNALAVSSNQPTAAAWRKDAPVPLCSPRGSLPPGTPRPSLVLFNLRQASRAVEVVWIDYDGTETRNEWSQVCLGQGFHIGTSADHLWRVYDACSGEFLGGVTVMSKDQLDYGAASPQRKLRALFGFDGFIGPSLRDAVTAFDGCSLLQSAPTSSHLFPTFPWPPSQIIVIV